MRYVMTSCALRFAFAVLSAMLMTGCVGKVHYPNYYTLALAPSQEPPSGESQKLPAVAVQRFETPAFLRQGRIVYRESPEQIGFYDYHRWASDPGQVVTTAMIDCLRSSGIFSAVETYDGQEHAPYLLQGRLERLDELDYKSGVQVEVRLSAQLLNTKTGTAVWAGATTKTAQVDERQMRSVVQAMGQATQKGIDQLVQEMRKQLFTATIATKDSTVSAAEKRVGRDK
jgi:ABC-type uncharacterized transport system auxiliary subunit